MRQNEYIWRNLLRPIFLPENEALKDCTVTLADL